MARALKAWGLVVGLLAAAAAQAGTVVFSTSVAPAGGVSLAAAPFTYAQGLSGQGFDPARYKVQSAALTLFFDDLGLGSNDNVSVGFNGAPPSGVVNDPPGLWLDSFQGQVAVDPGLVQAGLPLDVTLYQANARFTRSILAVQAELIGPATPPPGGVLVSASQHLEAAPEVNLAGGAHAFQHNIGLLGFDPAVDKLVDVSLRLFFRDGAANSDSNVEVQFDGAFGGRVHDPASLFTSLFDETLNVGPAWLQDDGLLDVTLQPGELVFLGSTLAFTYFHPAQAQVSEPTGSGLVALALLSLAATSAFRRRCA
ncbi:MAG: hypothetical protein HY855_25435 [Burkholderiales bacterium]|nr:hypothetical protein [Burkholderiales bacterium]